MVAHARSDLQILIQIRLYFEIEIHIECANSELRIFNPSKKSFAKVWLQIRALIYK